MPSSVLVLGSGGREHAIAWSLRSFGHSVHISPGNGSSFPSIELNLDDEKAISKWCEANGVQTVIVGPEVLLEKDIVNRMHAVNPSIKVFGPTKEAAQLETSKIYAKEFMVKNDIPTADYFDFETKFENATENAIRSKSGQWKNGIVVKMDGLASGKGVTVTSSTEEAIEETKRMLKSGNGRVLVEERLNGYEISALAFCDGKKAIRMPLAKDHKRLLEGDEGPNTGGMGVVGPVRVPSEVEKQIDEIFEKSLKGMKANGIEYKGVLYAGLMIVDNKAYVLEFNCRFGDPETQVILTLLKSDLLQIVNECVDGELKRESVQWHEETSRCVIILAGKNYPYSSDKGTPIKNIGEDTDKVIVFHAGTRRVADRIETNGGRILCVIGIGDSIDEARRVAIERAEQIEFDGKQFRKDIGVVRPHPCCGKREYASYQNSGVNITEGNEFVERIKKHVKSTLIEGTEQIGGFGALVDLNKMGLSGELVIGMDGVGTKLEVASAVNDYSQLGFDLVAMCANDVLCHCARPVAFLDYFVCGKLQLPMAEQVVGSICQACKEIKCAVVGGETAEMPGVYGEKQWDLAGCIVAIRQNDWPMLPLKNICERDELIGLPSSGVHSNGFSLVRRIITDNHLDYSDAAPWSSNGANTIGKELLKGTKLYVNQVLPLLKKGLVKGCAHITGGGLKENIIRCLSNNDLAVQVELGTWPVPPIFQFLAEMGPVETNEMLKVFNCGIGFVLIVDKSHYKEVKDHLDKINQPHYNIGKIIKRKSGEGNIHFTNPYHNIFKPTFEIKRPLQNLGRIRTAILISGTGSNMLKLIEHSRKKGSRYEVVLVLSNKPNAVGVERARQLGVEVRIVENTKVREDGEKSMTEILREFNTEMICLAGFMRILTPYFVSQWRNRILNIHPSLLPSFKGAHAVEEALEFGAKVTGCSVHLVDEEVDHGPILAQSAVPIGENETAESLHQLIQKEEHQLYPNAADAYAAKLLVARQ